MVSDPDTPRWHPGGAVLTWLFEVAWERTCDGCGQAIPAGAPHLHHRNIDTHKSLSECKGCAVRNGRPEFAEPDVPEVPLVWDGVA